MRPNTTNFLRHTMEFAFVAVLFGLICVAAASGAGA